MNYRKLRERIVKSIVKRTIIREQFIYPSRLYKEGLLQEGSDIWYWVAEGVVPGTQTVFAHFLPIKRIAYEDIEQRERLKPILYNGFKMELEDRLLITLARPKGHLPA